MGTGYRYPYLVPPVCVRIRRRTVLYHPHHDFHDSCGLVSHLRNMLHQSDSVSSTFFAKTNRSSESWTWTLRTASVIVLLLQYVGDVVVPRQGPAGWQPLSCILSRCHCGSSSFGQHLRTRRVQRLEGPDALAPPPPPAPSILSPLRWSMSPSTC